MEIEGKILKVSPLTRMFQFLKTDKSDIAAIYFYAILDGLVQLSLPMGVQAIISYVLGASMVTSIYVLVFLVVLGVLIVGILQINQMKIIERIQQRLFTNIAFDFADKIPKFDLYKMDDYYLPEKANRLFEAANLQKGISKLLIDIPSALISILFGLLLLSFYHPIFIIFGILLISLLALVLYLTSKKGMKTSINESNQKYTLVSWMQEVAKSINAFKQNQETRLCEKTTDNILVNYLTQRTNHFKILLFQYTTLIIFKTLVTAALLIIGVVLLIDQKLNIGEFIAAEIVILSIISSVEKLIKNLDTIYDVLTAIEKIVSVTENNSESNGSIALNNESIDIKLINMSFEYTAYRPILKNINLNVPANSSVCILGKENSGRSTLLKILSGNYNHFQGNFLVNNIPIQNYNINTIRKELGIFLNKQEIFSGTVLENITMGREEILANDIIEIANKIGIGDFLHDLPVGFDTVIDTAGKRLPTSMKQKLLLLRSLCSRPKLIVMEEPWLMYEDRYKLPIKNYLANKPNYSTVIICTNDLQFANQCDYRFELIDGELKKLS